MCASLHYKTHSSITHVSDYKADNFDKWALSRINPLQPRSGQHKETVCLLTVGQNWRAFNSQFPVKWHSPSDNPGREGGWKGLKKEWIFVLLDFVCSFWFRSLPFSCFFILIRACILIACLLIGLGFWILLKPASDNPSQLILVTVVPPPTKNPPIWITQRDRFLCVLLSITKHTHP